jgi:aryl-alcohol dehydrogenase-like predicted oxidoreductase
LTGKYNDGTIDDGDRFTNPFYKAIKYDPFMGDNTREDTIKLLNSLKEFSDELGITMAQLALAWVLVSKDVSTCLTGATKLSQIQSNIEALKIASEWNKEKEEKMNTILGNEPTPRMNYDTYTLDVPRRTIMVDYDFKLGKVHARKRKWQI